MAFAEIAKKIRYPAKTTARFKRLDALDRLRDGVLYDHIRIPFSQETDGIDGSGSYVPMLRRRPSIIWNGARMLVEQLAGLMWGDEQMPIVRTYYGQEPSEADRKAEESIQHIVEMLDLDAVMDEATERASSGSAAIVVRATDDKEPYIEVLPGRECTPTFDPRNPYKLLKLEVLYPTTGEALVEMGFAIPDDDLQDDFWYRLTFDKTDETRYMPMRADKFERLGEKDDDGHLIRWIEDADASGPHGWPVIPVLWVKAPKGNRVDGGCLYEPIKDMLVDMDYALSQISRGYRYTADPMLMIKRGELRHGATPASSNVRNKQSQTGRDSSGKIIKSASNVLDIEAGGDAKMLEISGQGLAAAGEFVKLLREWGLEICGGMKADAASTKGIESGRALEMLYQALMLVMKRWRVSLGNRGFIPLVRLLLTGIQDGIIEVEGVDPVSPDTTMRLVWPQWMTPTGADLAASVSAWAQLAGETPTTPVQILPRDVVTRLAATNLGLNDVSAIIDELDAQRTEDEAKAKAQADQQHSNAVDLVKAKPAPKAVCEEVITAADAANCGIG